MADLKISQLPVFTSAVPAVDAFAVVSGGTTKQITTNQVLGSGGTATLASATITGDLTVDSPTLVVDATNNRVGIGTAAPYSTAELLNARTTSLTNIAAFATMPLTVTDSTAFALGVGGGINFRAKVTSAAYSNYAAIWSYRESGTNSDYAGSLIFGTSDNTDGFPIERYRISSAGVATWSVAGTTAMTLNSTGLGIGASPAAKLYVYGANVSGIGQFRIDCPAAGVAQQTFAINGVAQGQVYADGAQMVIGSATSTPLLLRTNNTVAVTIDASQNVGVGVTPSAWDGNFKALQLGYPNFICGNAGGSTVDIGVNAYYNPDWKYALNSVAATRYRQASGGHIWYNAPNSGASGANTLITWTQAMTLTATGDLLIGTTSNTSFSARIVLSYDSGTTNWAVGPSVSTPTGFFISANVGAQGVYLANSTATSWTAWSDERLKDIIEPISNAVFKVGSLRAVIGKFKSDTTNTRKPFLIAQDVLAVLPEAVDVSNPKSFGVSYTEVIPLLVAAIKELTARVQTLEAR